MAFTGSITDVQTARRASQSTLQAQNLLGLVNGSLTSLAAAQAQCFTGQAALSICDRLFAVHSARSLAVGSAFSAPVTTSSLTSYYAALPSNGNKPQRMIS